MIDRVMTGNQIYEQMKLKKRSVRNVADALIVTDQAVYHWLNGTRLPSLENLVALRNFLGCKLEDLIREY